MVDSGEDYGCATWDEAGCGDYENREGSFAKVYYEGEGYETWATVDCSAWEDDIGGAIAGIVIGCLLFCVCICVCIFFCVKKARGGDDNVTAMQMMQM